MSGFEDANGEDQKPLDPAMERVRRKLARLLAISIGTLLVGLMAVLGAIVYKSGGSGVPGEAYRAKLALPAGFSVESADYGQKRIMFYGTDSDGNRHVVLYDAASGALVADHLVE